ncbi:MAG: BamA/TamA family outer membrane protein [Gammaproteobacteria bacterium]|nr:BamA/TamA family outer membrane protein [Gammaproteobacteria bacterium]MDH5801727.1 BamA/TamA family outer membrane protein [Gammaproteobacteria bacterium]
MKPIQLALIGAAVLISFTLHAADPGAATSRPADEKLPRVDEEAFGPQDKPQFELPPVQLPQEQRLSTKLQVRLSKIEFVGNTVFSQDVLSKLTNPYLNKDIGSLELEEIRLAVTNHYVNNGYINSGATIPDQDLEYGVLKMRITEGRLTDIKLKHDGKLNPSYITQRISPKPDQPLNILELQENLHMLQQNPRIKQINANLGPGEQRGQSNLDIRVIEDKPYELTLEINNHRPTSIGEWQGRLGAKHRNLSGNGDTLGIAYSGTEGLHSGELNYEYPIAPDDSSIKLDLSYSDSEVVDDNLPIEILNDSWSAKLSWSFPLYYHLQEKYLVNLALDRRHSASFLETGTVNCEQNGGNCEVTALRLTQTWLRRTNEEIMSLRHTVSVGVNAFHSTISNNGGADSRFSSWLIQGQWAQRYQPTLLQSIFRMDLQLTQDVLLPMEQFALGGANTVRGYRENFIIRDNGFLASWEGRLPTIKRDSKGNSLYTMAFVDYGYSWNSSQKHLAKTIYSAGLGLRFNYRDNTAFTLYWAEPLTDGDTLDEDNLQDDGLHLSLQLKY